MNTPSKLLHIITYCGPRGLFISPAQFFNRTGGNLFKVKNFPIVRNPHELITSSPKHNNPDFNHYLFNHVDNLNKFQTSLSLYGISTPVIKSSESNYWLYTIRQDYSFAIELEAQKNIWWFKSIPGVKNLFLSGSASLGGATKNSDIDIIFEVYPMTAWLARFWIKAIFKMQGRDVFKLSFQFYKLLHILKLINKDELDKKISDYKQRKGVKMDAGLFTTNWLKFAKDNIPKEPFMIFLHGSRIIELTVPIPFHKKIVSIFLKIVLTLTSIPSYPFVVVWALVYIVSHKNVPHIHIGWNNVCFYPIRHAPFKKVHVKKIHD